VLFQRFNKLTVIVLYYTIGYMLPEINGEIENLPVPQRMSSLETFRLILLVLQWKKTTIV